MTVPILPIGNAHPAGGGFVPPSLPQPPVNPYAPTGWKRKERVEFDLELPSGQLARIMRLDRDDLFRLGLMEYLDTFTPILLEDTSLSDAEKNEKVKQVMMENSSAMSNMLTAIDKVVMAVTIRPAITEDEALVNYGAPEDWTNPDFIATVHLSDIATEERMFIFGAAFGRSMDDLKSIYGETQGLGSLQDVADVQHDTESAVQG